MYRVFLEFDRMATRNLTTAFDRIRRGEHKSLAPMGGSVPLISIEQPSHSPPPWIDMRDRVLEDMKQISHLIGQVELARYMSNE